MTLRWGAGRRGGLEFKRPNTNFVIKSLSKAGVAIAENAMANVVVIYNTVRVLPDIW